MRIFSNYTIILAAICSTIIHFFAVALVDTFTLIPKRLTLRSDIFMVDLIPSEKVVVTPEKEVQKKEKTEINKASKKEVKKEVEKVKSVAVTKRTKAKKEKQKIDDEQKRLAAIKKIEKRVAGRGAVVTPSQMEHYFGMVRERVKGFWVIPDTVAEEEGMEAVVVVTIDKNGLVLTSRFERVSGNPYFDQSAMRAITKASPFPPPPGKVPLEFGLVFQPH